MLKDKIKSKVKVKTNIVDFMSNLRSESYNSTSKHGLSHVYI